MKIDFLKLGMAGCVAGLAFCIAAPVSDHWSGPVACRTIKDTILFGGERYFPGERVYSTSCYGRFGTRLSHDTISVERY